jgi:outer membrane immunogenic protein
MKKITLAAAALSMLFTGAASAADMAVKARPAPVPLPVATWTGCYIGVNAGYSWSNGSSSLALQPSLAAWTALSPAYAQFDGRYGNSPEGGRGGGQVGCNYQSGMFVFGVEADIDYLGATKTFTTTANIGLPTLASLSQKLDWLGSVRGRVGIAPAPSWLLYLTGGLAYGNTSFSHFFGFSGPNIGFAGAITDSVRTGWIAGIGSEYMLTPNWTVRGEYLYYDLGSTRVFGAPFNQPANGFGADALYTTRGSIARVGLNYKFGWGGPVVARY